MNLLHPDRMTSSERLDEVARLLALAIQRRKARMLAASESSQNGLEFPRDVRLHVTPKGVGT